MQCLSPLSLLKYEDNQQVRHTVPCGQCAFCLSNKRAEWSFRLNQELKSAYSAHFLTLTYDIENIPITKDGLTQLSKRDVQLFLKRLRKKQGNWIPNLNKTEISPSGGFKIAQIRYYMVGEYGEETQRPHYHGIMFNINKETITQIESIWKKGHVLAGSVTPASINYVTKYVITKNLLSLKGRLAPFALMSRKPAIGNNYLKNNYGHHKENKKFYVRNENGTKQNLPRYYKEKIFSKREREERTVRAIREADTRYLSNEERLRIAGNQVAEYELRQKENAIKRIEKSNKNPNPI